MPTTYNWDQNHDVLQGNNLSLYLTSDKKVVAYGTNVSLQIDAETIDTSSKMSCRWSDALGGKASYTISSDSLYTQNSGGTSFDNFVEMMVAGDQIEWYIGEEECYSGSCASNPHSLNSGVTYYNGKAIVTSVSLNAGMDESVSCSISMQGCGPIEKNGQTIQEGNPCED